MPFTVENCSISRTSWRDKQLLFPAPPLHRPGLPWRRQHEGQARRAAWPGQPPAGASEQNWTRDGSSPPALPGDLSCNPGGWKEISGGDPHIMTWKDNIWVNKNIFSPKKYLWRIKIFADCSVSSVSNQVRNVIQTQRTSDSESVWRSSSNNIQHKVSGGQLGSSARQEELERV